MRTHKIFRFIFKISPFFFLFVTALITIFIHKNDTTFEKNWIIFYMWFATFAISIVYALSLFSKKSLTRVYTAIKQEWLIIVPLFLFALFIHSLFIDVHPYVKIGDSVRDAGINALRIKQGVLKDFFGFGAYNGYGNFVPLIGYFFSFIFGISPYMYLVPATIVGALSVTATYILMRLGYNAKKSLIAALFLLSIPLHLNYSRSELVVISDSLLSVLILITTLNTVQNTAGFFLLGLLYGLSLNFYSGIRGVIAISFLYISLQYFIKWVQLFKKTAMLKRFFYMSIKKIIITFVVLSIGIIIGAGPKLNNFTRDTLTGTINGKLIIKDEVFLHKKPLEKLIYLNNTYTKAFLIYFSEETTSRFRNLGALIPFPLNWFFMIGFFYLLLLKKEHKNNLNSALFFVALLFPFTNEVIINSIGIDHRLMSGVPVAAAIAAIGFVTLLERLFENHPRVASYFINIGCILLISSQLWLFFYTRPSDNIIDADGVKEYVIQSVADYIQKGPMNTTYHIVNNSPYEFFGHHKEKLELYAYPKKTTIIEMDELNNYAERHIKNPYEKYIYFEKSDRTPELQNAQEFITHCEKNALVNYRCPKGFSGEYRFYVL